MRSGKSKEQEHVLREGHWLCKARLLQHTVQHIIYMGPCGSMGDRHQQRPQLHQDYGPRHSHQEQLGPGCHHDHRWHHRPVCRMGQTLAWSLDFNMTPGDSQELRSPCDFWWQNGPWTATYTPAEEDPKTLTWFLAEAGAWMLPFLGSTLKGSL